MPGAPERRAARFGEGVSPDRSCPLCGGPNDCAPARSGGFAEPCWCEGVAVDPAVLERIDTRLRGTACVCARCASAASAQ